MSLHHGLRSAAGASVADPDFENVSLLLLGNGTNGGQNNTFVDGSSNAFSITRYGNTTQGTFSPFGYNWSNYFDGNGDYLVFTPGADFAFGTGDFTVECWYFPTVDPTDDYIFDTRTSSSFTGLWAFAYNSTGTDPGKLFWANNTTQLGQSSVTTITNAWNHLCYVRSGTTGSLYVNGTRVGTQTDNYNYNTNPGAMRMGARYSVTTNNQYAKGYLSNVRVVKGTAVYDPAQTSLTVPTAPLTAITNTKFLSCQSNRFLDNSSNAFTITPYGNASVTNFAPFPTNTEYSTGTNGGSGYFDGTGDYLTAGAAADWKFLHDGSDWSIEFWVYHSTTNLDAVASTTWWTGEIGMSVLLNLGTANTVSVEFYRGVGGSLATFNSSANLSINQWNHVAITFSSSGKTCSFYINGTSAGSSSNTGFSYSSSSPTNTMAIGRAQGSGGANTPGGEIDGFIGSLRISSNIRTGLTTLPTAPYASDANTKLLLNWTNAAIIDSTGKNNLETVGDAQISTSTKKFGTGSLKFDGTGDGLIIPQTDNLKFGTGDFTVEFWLYLNANQSNFTKYFSSGTATGSFVIDQQTVAGKITVNDNNTVLLTSSSTVSNTTWTHVAVVRSGTTMTMYFDGVSVGSVTDSTNFTSGISSVGSNSTGGSSVNGYMDDFRATKGKARYSSAFTPPTRQLPAR